MEKWKNGKMEKWKNGPNQIKFLEYFDGFSIGSNDLTQLTLG
jgi:hypothetical protein